MAFQLQVTKVVHGEQLVFDGAYHQITSINGNKERIEILLTTYKDATKQEILDQRLYVFEPSQADDSKRWDKQGYEYLKTLDEYANAIDC